MLRNDSFEVYDAESEEEAKEYARKILWGPVMNQGYEVGYDI
jgi:hypothetical protein